MVGAYIPKNKYREWESMQSRIIEPFAVIDIYADGIDHIENLGNVMRIVYFTWQRIGSVMQRTCVAKIVRPTASLLSPKDLARMLEDQPVVGMLPNWEPDSDHNGH